MKIAIIMTRNYDIKAVKDNAITLAKELGATWVHTADNGSAFKLGWAVAAALDAPLVAYEAEWQRYGRGAGVVRAKEMLKEVDAVICIWDGKSKGTKNEIEMAKKYKKPVYFVKGTDWGGASLLQALI